MPLAAVETLSDEECLKPTTIPKPPAQQRPKRPKRPGQKRRARIAKSTADPQKLRHLIMATCGCTLSCFDPFRHNYSLWEKWLNLRMLFDKMTKLEKDRYAWYSKQIQCESI